MNLPSGFTRALSSRSRTRTPRQVVSSLLQRVTQWMSTVTSVCGSAISSSQESCSSSSTWPKSWKSQVERSIGGLGPTVRTGKRSVRYWPGGTRAGSMPSFSACLRPRWPNMREVTAIDSSLGNRQHRGAARYNRRPLSLGRAAALGIEQGARRKLAYVIAEPCIDTKDNSCVEVCPVDCIHPTPEEPDYDNVAQLFIDPDECIDCDACVEACPVDACFAEDQLPDEWQKYTEINAAYYKKS